MNASVSTGNISESLIDGTPYKVADVNGYRVLLTAGDETSAHSVMSINEPDALVLPYTRTMLSALALVPRVDDILLIGLGGGQQAKFIYRRLPEVRLVAVEIDHDMVNIARSHFSVPDNDERFSVVTGDGCEYVKTHPHSCEVLLCDGYDKTFNASSSLEGEAFYRACHRALRPGGVMALNLYLRSDAWRAAHLSMIGGIFPAHMEIPLSEEQSVMLFSRDPFDMDYRALMLRVNALEKRLALGLPATVTHFEHALRSGAELIA